MIRKRGLNLSLLMSNNERKITQFFTAKRDLRNVNEVYDNKDFACCEGCDRWTMEQRTSDEKIMLDELKKHLAKQK